MVQRSHSTGFPLEPFSKLRSGDLDRNIAVKASVASAVDFTHASRTDPF
jgi:hypothetical protein